MNDALPLGNTGRAALEKLIESIRESVVVELATFTQEIEGEMAGAPMDYEDRKKNFEHALRMALSGAFEDGV